MTGWKSRLISAVALQKAWHTRQQQQLLAAISYHALHSDLAPLTHYKRLLAFITGFGI